MTPAMLLAWAQTSAASDGEVAWRAAASRAYYAAYHAALRWHDSLAAQGVSTRGGGVHQQPIERLLNPAPECAPAHRTASRQAGHMLRAMRVHRVAADYRLDHPFDAVMAAQVCASAAELLRRLG